jgi:hypothetical protein
MSLQADFLRLCHLHSWYKHIPLEGRDYYAFLQKGQQPRNCLQPQVFDAEGLHWHFSIYPPEDPNIPSYKVRLGPFLRGIEYCRSGYPRCFWFNCIYQCAGKTKFQEWIRTHYPYFSHIDWNDTQLLWEDAYIIEEICMTEWNRYWADLQAAVSQ